jgi:hypothetical protein
LMLELAAIGIIESVPSPGDSMKIRGAEKGIYGTFATPAHCGFDRHFGDISGGFSPVGGRDFATAWQHYGAPARDRNTGNHADPCAQHHGQARLGTGQDNCPLGTQCRLWQDVKSGKFYFSTTTNGGRTWQAGKALTIGQGFASCEFQVDPTNAKDALMGMVGCDAEPCDGDAFTPYYWYRTADGGQTWNPLVDPPGVAVAKQHGFPLVHQFSWVGSTLYAKVAPFSQSGASYPISNYFLVSENGGPLTGFDTPQFYAAMGSNVIKSLISVPFISKGGIAVLYSDAPIGVQGGISSSDGGKTWTPFTPQVAGGSADNLEGFQLTSFGQTLYTYAIATPNGQQVVSIVRSTDGGHTWAPLAVPPPGTITSSSSVFLAPDSTLFTITYSAGGGIVRLLSGAKHWDVLVPYTKSADQRATVYNFKAISWDTDGHPVALWGDIWVFGDQTLFVPNSFGLVYHAASPGN